MTFNIINDGDPGLASPVMQNFRHVNYGSALIPVNNTGSGVDNTIDLGSSAFNFKDGYFSGNITVDDDSWIGLGSGAARIEFDDQSTDEINFLDCNFGIGTASPSSLTHLYSDSSTTDGTNGLLIEEDGTGDATLRFLITGARTWAVGCDNSDEDKFKIGTAAGWASGTAMTIDSAGNVGINTTGPDRKLDVLDASNPQLRLTQADGTVYTDIQTNSSGNTIFTNTGGNFGINTSGPDRKLDILDASNPQLRLTHTDGSIYAETQCESDGDVRIYQVGGGTAATYTVENSDQNTAQSTMKLQLSAYDDTDTRKTDGIEIVANSTTTYFQTLTSNASYWIFGSASTNTRIHPNYLAIPDGVTAPGTITGMASIYVDTSDGDLKVKFADGTVKTIATDT